MKYYLFDTDGFLWGTFYTFTDAYEEMENYEPEYCSYNLPEIGWFPTLFITTKENPWR